MTTHSYTGADATINDPVELKLSGSAVVARNLGDFTTSDLSAWCPLAMDSAKSVWNACRCYFSNSTYQPKTGDVPSDGSGHLALTVTNVANAGWYQFLRTLPTTLWVGNNTSQTANGLYVDFDFEFSAIGQAHRLGAINPHYYDSNYAIPPSLSLHNSQYDLRGYEEDTTAANSSNSGSSLAINTRYYARETFGTNSITLKIYTSDADRTNDTNVFRTCTVSNIDVMRVQAVGAFVRYNTAGSVVKVYNFGGTVCDWYGQNKTVTFDEIDFGTTKQYVYFNTFSATTSGAVAYQYRYQATDGVWGAWSDIIYAGDLANLADLGCYAFQLRAIFNPCTGGSVASLTSVSFQSGDARTLSKPTITGTTAGDGQVAIAITAASPTDTVYVRYRISGAWSSETATFSTTGSGTVTVTGLTNEVTYQFGAYSKSGAETSAWDFAFAAPTDGSTKFTLRDRIYYCLSNDGNVTGIVGSGNSAKLYPYGVAVDGFPRLVYRVLDNVATEEKFKSGEYRDRGQAVLEFQAIYNDSVNDAEGRAYTLLQYARKAIRAASLTNAGLRIGTLEVQSESPVWMDDASMRYIGRYRVTYFLSE